MAEEERQGLRMTLEIIARLLMILGTWFAFRLAWWAPLLAAPLIWQILKPLHSRTIVLERLTDEIVSSRSFRAYMGVKLFLDYWTHVVYVVYWGLAVVLCWIHFGHWWGLAIGGVVGLLVVQIFGLLWPNRWRLEAI